MCVVEAAAERAVEQAPELMRQHLGYPLRQGKLIGKLSCRVKSYEKDLDGVGVASVVVFEWRFSRKIGGVLVDGVNSHKHRAISVYYGRSAWSVAWPRPQCGCGALPSNVPDLCVRPRLWPMRVCLRGRLRSRTSVAPVVVERCCLMPRVRGRSWQSVRHARSRSCLAWSEVLTMEAACFSWSSWGATCF